MSQLTSLTIIQKEEIMRENNTKTNNGSRRNFLKNAAVLAGGTAGVIAFPDVMRFSSEAFGAQGTVVMGDSTQKDASGLTRDANAAMLNKLPFKDVQDFEDSRRGFMVSLNPMVIDDDNGLPAWDMRNYTFLDGSPVDTVNPSLWRQEQLNNIHGLFKIHPRIYQVRNFDLANMTLVKGSTGWIIIDTMLTRETSRAAMKLVDQHLGKLPIVAVIYTHSHVDHFGGVRGIVDEKDVASGKIKIFAPDGFMEYAIAENVLAGNAMNRRAYYQFGNIIPPGKKGHVGAGLGKGISLGTIGLIPPTDIINKTGQEVTIDGVRVVFQMANGSEAPAEHMFYFPEFKALCLSEVTSHHMHNLYTLRGAQVRDALKWSKYINETIGLFGDEVELAFASHHWPTWGNERIRQFLVVQRDLYRYMHDETLRLVNLGYTPREISEEMTLPSSLAKEFNARGYYGTLSHNVKAVYQFYMGWYDGNPANLNPLPPVEAGKRYVEFMGGADTLLQKARKAFDQGDYRWVAEVVNHLVFADPKNKAALNLQADALEQLGYQSESGVWRNEYLAGAGELRNGVNRKMRVSGTAGADVMRAMTLDMVFDFIGIRLKKDAVKNMNIAVNLEFTNINTNYALELSNSVLNNTRGRVLKNPAATYRMSTVAFAKLIGQQATFPALLGSGEITVQGNPKALGAVLANLEIFDPNFNIVTP
jgi:alkyl sulfatase BDS1-like metallo-beta-lactamase superfamily hydrolase